MRVHARSSIGRLSLRAQAGPRSVSFLCRADSRVSRRSDGRWPSLSAGGSDLRPRASARRARTLLAYRIEPGDRRFQALVGVDERAGPLGSVVFRVLVDGKERFKTPPMTDRDAPQVDRRRSRGRQVLDPGHRIRRSRRCARSRRLGGSPPDPLRTRIESARQAIVSSS